MSEDPEKQVEQVVQDFEALVRRLAKETSVAGLLAENEPIGELVTYSLLDDTRLNNDLGARLKILAEWLRKTEERYKSRFPDDFPQKDGQYDLTNKPAQFKTRFEIFNQLAEAWEAASLWSAEILLEDPLLIVKRMK